MKIFFAIFIFCLILVMYLHIVFHLKTSNELEVYEIENVSKEKLEEICDVRQPVLFDFYNERLMKHTSFDYLYKQYSDFEFKIRNTKECGDDETSKYIPLSLLSCHELFEKDKEQQYFTEKNEDFLQETSVIKSFQHNDEYLRPFLVSNCKYDVMSGSNGCTTPFRYSLNYRNYFLVTQGTIHIKLACPKSSKYLFPKIDYENFEFYSPVNPWDVQMNYQADFNKIKCLELTLTPGKIIFIPAYWWYSIQFSKNASVSCMYYRSYMNDVAISPHLCMYGLQLMNIKRERFRKVETMQSKDGEKDKKKNHKIISPSSDVEEDNSHSHNNHQDTQETSHDKEIGNSNEHDDIVPLDINADYAFEL